MDEELVKLKACQTAAIRCVFEHSRGTILETSAGAEEDLYGGIYYKNEHNRIAELIKRIFPIDVQFHPDRIAKNGRTVIDGLLGAMIYENQFASGISNGLLDTSVASRRKRWESRLFGCTYDDQPDLLRPKYGAINLFSAVDGACPRFGSCYLRLGPQVHGRCTLTYGDSHIEPDNIGTANSLNQILNALRRDYLSHGKIESKEISLKTVSRRLKKKSREDTDERIICRNLDDIVEVHIHGDLRIDRDVEYISVDSSFNNTEIGRNIVELAAAAKIDVNWRPGLRLRVCIVPPSFRGEVLLTFMKHCWQDGHVDAYRLGILANEIESDPNRWSAWGRHYDVLQLIKQTWHSIVAYGDLVEIDQ